METKNSYHVKDENQVPFQRKKSALPLPVRKISKRKILGPLPLQPPKKETGSKKASAQAFCVNETSAHLINEKSLEPTPQHTSLLEEQQAFGIDFQVDASSLKSILENVGIQATRCPIGSSKKNPQTPGRVLVEDPPLSTPLKVRNSVYCQGPTVRMSLAESCRSYQKKLRTEAGFEEASASPKLLCTPKTACLAESPLIRSLKSEQQPRSVYPKYSQRFLIKELFGSSVSREDCPSTPDLMQNVHALKSSHSLVKSVREASRHTPLRVPKTPSSVTMASFSRVRCDSQTRGRAPASICATESRKIHQKRLVWADILSSPELPLSTLKLSESTPGEDLGSSYRHDSEDNHDSSGGDGRRPGGRGAAGRQERGHGRTAQGARQPRTARAAADDDDDSSPAVTHPPAWSQRSYYYHGHYHLYSSSSNNSSSETGALRGGCAATQVVNSSTAPVPPAFTPAAVAGGGDNGVAAGGAGRREVELRRRADAVPRPAGGSADGDAALLARLQALEEEEHLIQNEMQLLTMAMHREHEGDSNGNHLKSSAASSTTTSATTTGTTGTTATIVSQCPPAARPAAQLNVQLDHECTERSLTISVPPSVSWPCALQNAAFQTEAGTNNSGALCPSADINCNPLGPARSAGMEDKDAAHDAMGGVGGSTLLAACRGEGLGRDHEDSNESRDESLASCNALYRLQTSILVSTTATFQADHSTDNDSITSPDASVAESTTGENHHQQQLTTDGLSPSNRLSWQISAQPSRSVAVVSSWPAHPSARHSVDMETDDQLSLPGHDALSLSSHADVQLVAARATDANAEPHGPPTTALPRLSKLPCSSPVLITPVSLVPSSADRGRCESLRMTPPIWTALALRLAANTQEEASAGRHWRGAVSHRPAASRLALPCLAELEDVVKAMNRSVSLSPKLKHKVSPSKRAPMISPNKLAHKVSASKRALTRRNRSASPASPLSGSIAARSPRRARLRRAEAAIGLGTALREVDVFLEALLEDECALYAGRLQAFFRHDAACDRTELPDPVAKILNEGDDMHFVPIRQEAGLLAAVEGSAFSCYIPT